MNNEASPINDLKEIRSLMERSSRFMSLSGLSGVSAGVCGLAAAFFTHWYLSREGLRDDYVSNTLDKTMEYRVIINLFFIGVVTLFLAVGSATYFTLRKTVRTGDRAWDTTSKRLMVNILMPLVTGGVYCMALMYHGEYGLIAPSTLVFYGLALLNGSKYTLNDIRYLGVSQIVLGLIALFYVGYGLEFWALGFGVLHIVYGGAMWYKYDRKG